MVFIDGPNRRCAAFFPVRDQLVDAARIHYRAGKNVRADFLAFFEDGNGRILPELSKTVGGGETGRPATNNQNIDFRACRVRTCEEDSQNRVETGELGVSQKSGSCTGTQ